MTNRTARLAHIAHWIDTQDAEYLTPLSTEAPEPPEAPALEGITCFNPWATGGLFVSSTLSLLNTFSLLWPSSRPLGWGLTLVDLVCFWSMGGVVRHNLRLLRAWREAHVPHTMVAPDGQRGIVVLRWQKRGLMTAWDAREGQDAQGAWAAVLSTARAGGWTPPRWWEWTRRHDTRVPTAALKGRTP